MGEVYLAEDTQLGRKLALKLLPAQLTADADRLRRFKQEARAASALNHPNIITIFEIGQEGSTHYIATEFIDGQTLRQRMMNAPEQRMKPSEAVERAAQIAAALAAAHEAGSSTATSSRRMSWCGATAWSRCWTSAWPS
jgi:serine/threonine protein kinase